MKKSINFSYEAHYSLSHEPLGTEQEIWLVLHGYGQLAEFFIRKFLPIASSKRLILAPEGTNYGYLEGYQGRVGANWMTRHEREVAIANTHRFLDQLIAEVLSRFSIPPKIHVLGFSQGAATATRWAGRWEKNIETLVLWAGGFAHDLVIDLAKEKFKHTQIILVTGDQDPMITVESIAKQRQMLASLQKEEVHLKFSGGHHLETGLLEKILNLEISG